MTNTIFTTLITLFILLQYQLWLGESSIIKTINLNKIYDQQFKVNKLLEKENQQLYLEYVNLKDSNLFIEEIARKDLGYIKKDEKYYKIKR